MKSKSLRFLSILSIMCSCACDKKPSDSGNEATAPESAPTKSVDTCESDWKEASNLFCVGSILIVYHNTHTDEFMADWRSKADRLTAVCTNPNEWGAIGASATAEAARRLPTTPQSIMAYCDEAVEHAAAGLPPSVLQGSTTRSPIIGSIGSDSGSTLVGQPVSQTGTPAQIETIETRPSISANPATAPIVQQGATERCAAAKNTLNYNDLMGDLYKQKTPAGVSQEKWNRRISSARVDVSNILSEFRFIVDNDLAGADKNSLNVAEKCESDAERGRGEIENLLRSIKAEGNE